MKAKIKPIVFLSILIIILIIGILFIITENKKDRTSNFYKKLLNNQKYTFSMEKQNIDYKCQINILKNENNYCINMYNDNEHTSTLLKDGYIYYIMYDAEEYYSTYDEEANINIVESALSSIENKNYEKGKENINGIQYYYEEYKDVTDFIMNISITEEDEIRTRFYFEGNNIKYIKNISEEDDELLEVNYTFNINEEEMEIPANFAEK